MVFKKIVSLSIALSVILSNSLIPIYAMDNIKSPEINVLEDYTDLYNLKKKKSKEAKNLKTTGKINNIAVFIEFEDQKSITINDSDTRAKAEEVFNTGGTNDSSYGKIPLVSLNQYLKSMSYNKLDVKTSIYPNEKNGTTVIPYVSSKPRTYFMKKSNLAPDGYTNIIEQNKRESELLEGALNHVKSQIEKDFTGDHLDTNNDGYIDAISFFTEGNYGPYYGIGFQDLLWPHKADGYFQTKIAGKDVFNYNLITTGDPNYPGGIFSKTRTAYGVIVHEFLHVLGLPDLYRNSQIGNPVGQWSMMASNGSQALNPITAFYQNEYLNWGSKLQVIGPGTHKVTLSKPKYDNPNEKKAVIIKSPLNKNESFVVEFRKKEGFNKYVNMDHGGIIVYRINNKFNPSNGNKIEDFMYVFRPGETRLGDGNGDLNKATLSLESGRTSLGKDTPSSNTFDNDTIHYSDGTNSRIVISNVSSGNNDTITFDVKVPSTKGSGTASDPYLISEASDLDLVKGQSNAHFKMTNDIDMSKVNNFEGLGYFSGNFDGQGYKIKNLTIKQSSPGYAAALFDSIDMKSTVKNLVLENVNIVNTSGRAASLVGSASGNINNVKVESGKVEGSKSNSGGLDASGGLIAYSTDSANISNSYSKANVVGAGNVGGLIGINSNAKIENTYSLGSVSKKESSDRTGGLIGLNLFTSGEKYKQPKNSYFDINSSKQSDGIGYVDIWGNTNIGGTGKEGVTGIKVDTEINLDVLNLPSKKINVATTPNTTLNGSWSSQNQSIATVSNGVVTAKSKGNTKILYTLGVGTNNMVLTTNVNVEDSTPKTEFETLTGLNRFETATKISSKWDKAENVVITNGFSIVDSLAASPLAASKDAPVLLSPKDKLHDATKKELQRLKTKTVYLIGGESALGKNIEKELKNMGISTVRIFGKNRFETSVEIAKYIAKTNKISDIAIVNGLKGLADAVSIGPVASQNKMPIILSDKDSLPSGSDFIKSQNINKIYTIGGKSNLSDKLINELNKLSNGTVTRIFGSRREETNINIIKEFYKSDKLNNIFVSKNGIKQEGDLVDSITIGSLAAREKSPVLLVDNNLKDYQKQFISSIKASKITKVGGNGNENAFEEIKSLVNNK